MKQPALRSIITSTIAACALTLATAGVATTDSRDDTSLWGIAPEANEIKVNNLI